MEAHVDIPMSFKQFLEKMADPRAQDIVQMIKRFLRQFQGAKGRPDPQLDSKRVQSFLLSLEPVLRSHIVFAGCTVADIDAAIEGTEKYVMTKLHDQLFGRYPGDADRDRILAVRLAALQFIEPRNLDVPTDKGYREDLWVAAARELSKMDDFKAPRDKLICLVNCCKIIMNSLASKSGADEFFPVLLLVVIRAAPRQLESNLQYIERFRRSSQLAAESAYFLASLASAAAFIESVDASKLNVDPEEFMKHMAAAGLPEAQPPSAPSAAPGGAAPLFEGLVVRESDPGSTAAQAAPAAPTAAEGGLDSLPSAADMLSAEEDRRPVVGLVRGAASALFGLNPLGRGGGGRGGTPMNARPQQASREGSIWGRPAASQSDPSTSGPAYPTLEVLEAEGWPLVLEAEAGGALAGRYRFLHAQPGDLTLRDVEGLLQSYKEIALKHECLLRAVEARTGKTAAGANNGANNGAAAVNGAGAK